ncbi:hypothetical protein BKA70DRAFT_1428638 [Coprinopsis sp. MPI-PUGE-AT-0042]|nr:hypothetical protein BKA70DRAFT_1428638 [Coprinopsis sp. MPI-PUGE-AT-0042]
MSGSGPPGGPGPVSGSGSAGSAPAGRVLAIVAHREARSLLEAAYPFLQNISNLTTSASALDLVKALDLACLLNLPLSLALHPPPRLGTRLRPSAGHPKPSPNPNPKCLRLQLRFQTLTNRSPSPAYLLTLRLWALGKSVTPTLPETRVLSLSPSLSHTA